MRKKCMPKKYRDKITKLEDDLDSAIKRIYYPHDLHLMLKSVDNELFNHISNSLTDYIFNIQRQKNNNAYTIYTTDTFPKLL